MSYRKVTTVEAWQVPQVTARLNAKYPAWVIAALLSGKLRPTAGPVGSIAMETKWGTQVAAVGDWIIHNVESDEMYPIHDNVFRTHYEPIPEAANG
jgi:hypothetical protein